MKKIVDSVATVAFITMCAVTILVVPLASLLGLASYYIGSLAEWLSGISMLDFMKSFGFAYFVLGWGTLTIMSWSALLDYNDTASSKKFSKGCLIFCGCVTAALVVGRFIVR